MPFLFLLVCGLAIKEAHVHPTVVAYMEVCFGDGFAFGRSVHFVLRKYSLHESSVCK